MSSVPWPVNLPQEFQRDGASIEPVSTSTQIDVESGEPLTRNRFTGEMDNFSGTLMPLTFDEQQQIYDFWRYDLKNGTLRVSWDHPISGEACEMLILSLRISKIGGDTWKADLQIQTMPT